jgi:adenylate kinase
MHQLTQKPYKVILFGPQGSGKGTQAHLLSEDLGIPTFSMGQLIRDEIATGSEMGKRFAPIVEEGKLIADADAAALLKRRLANPDAQDGYILDGFPRDRAQAKAFNFDRPTHLIIIHIPHDVSLDRLKGRLTDDKTGKIYSTKDGHVAGEQTPDGGTLFVRKDDVPEAIEKRLQIYQTETFAVIDEYVQTGIPIHHVDGIGTVEEVQKRLVDAIEQFCYVPH